MHEHSLQTEELEIAGRAALELRAGRRFDDQEWMLMRRKFIDFYTILRGWEKTEKEADCDKRKSKQ